MIVIRKRIKKTHCIACAISQRHKKPCDCTGIADLYLSAIQECRDTFANVYHEECSPYSELSWAFSRIIGTEPKDHVPASRWHNALCYVSANDVLDFNKWSKSVLELHIGCLQRAIADCDKQTYRYSSCYWFSAPDLEHETTAYIDREIKRVYPNVRRNTKRYKELFERVRVKARKLTADRLIQSATSELVKVQVRVADDTAEADKVRAKAYDLEQTSTWVLKLCPESGERIGAETRAMLDALLAHARQIEWRLAGDVEMIQEHIAEMTRVKDSADNSEVLPEGKGE